MDSKNRVYEPDKLLFHVYDFPENDDEDCTIFFTTKRCWEKRNCASDNLGSHNMPIELLTKCGVHPYELMESVFEIREGFTPKQVKTLLLEAGFCEDAEFSKFLMKFQE